MGEPGFNMSPSFQEQIRYEPHTWFRLAGSRSSSMLSDSMVRSSNGTGVELRGTMSRDCNAADDA